MNKAIMLAILAGGIVLVIHGIAASKSFSSDVSRFFTGQGQRNYLRPGQISRQGR